MRAFIPTVIDLGNLAEWIGLVTLAAGILWGVFQLFDWWVGLASSHFFGEEP
jgi:hypothetical protein